MSASSLRPAVRLVDVSFAHDDVRPLLDHVHLHLHPSPHSSFVGLVGANGSGKTTFLRLLAGDLDPTRGQVMWDPPEASRLVCSQSADVLDETIDAFAWAFDTASLRLHDLLRLDLSQLARWSTLSPGERKRWQLGAALWRRPEVLLLDEPTNHLDLEARRWVADALAGFEGLGLIVSHDRQLLDSCTGSTVRLKDARIDVWPDAYTRARAGWLAEQGALERQLEHKRRELTRVTRAAHARSELREQIAGRGRTSQRMKNRKDSDARSVLAKNRVASAQRAAAKQARTLATRRDAIRREQVQLQARVTAGMQTAGAIRILDDAPDKAHLMSVRLVDVPIHDADDVSPRPLRGPTTLWVARGDRIWLRGRNGAGKTTLLTALTKCWRFHPDRLLELPQELDEAGRRSALRGVAALPPPERASVLSLLANLGTDPDALCPHGWDRACDVERPPPSPGEARKLALARAMTRGCWCLALDEPTNHLDLSAIERLQAALEQYTGALLLITHDETLARATTTTVWDIGEDRVLRIS